MQAADIIKESVLPVAGTWHKAASAAEQQQFKRVFDRLHAHEARRSTGSPRRSGLLGSTGGRSAATAASPATLASVTAKNSRSTYANDFRAFDATKPRAIIPQNKHTRLDDFDQRVPPSTYDEDFVDHTARTRGADILAANPHLVASSKAASLRAMASGPPQSMYSTDFHTFMPKEAAIARAASVKPLHGGKTAGRPEDPAVRRFLLSSIYQNDFVDHEDRKEELLAEARAAPPAEDHDPLNKTQLTIYQQSFRDLGNPGEFRGQTVKSLYLARGGLPGVPDMNGPGAAEAAVRSSLLSTTYTTDFTGAAGEQALYADIVADEAKPAVANYLATGASDAEKAEFKEVFGKLRKEAAAAAVADGTAPPARTGHKFFV